MNMACWGRDGNLCKEFLKRAWSLCSLFISLKVFELHGFRGKELEYSSLKTYEILSNKSLLIDNSEITTNFQCAADYHVIPIR